MTCRRSIFGAAVLILASLGATAAQAQRTRGLLVAIEQDGKTIRPQQGELRVRRAPFTLILSLPGKTAVMARAEATDTVHRVAQSGRTLDDLFPDGGAFAEKDFNAGQALMLSDDGHPGFHFWYYDSEADHRFDSVAVRGSTLTARRTVAAVTTPDRAEYLIQRYPGRDVYLTLRLVDPQSRAERGRESVRIVLAGAPASLDAAGARSGAAAPVRLDAALPPPRKIKHVDPVYPMDALRARVQGNVVVEATLGEDGSVQDARIIKSNPLFDAAALDAVRQWQFEPVLINGIPTRVIVTSTVTFSLK